MVAPSIFPSGSGTPSTCPTSTGSGGRPAVERRNRRPDPGLVERQLLREAATDETPLGDAYDNALMETINGLFKAECVRTTVFHDGPKATATRCVRAEYHQPRWCLVCAPMGAEHGPSHRGQ